MKSIAWTLTALILATIPPALGAQTVSLLPGAAARGLSRDGVAATGWAAGNPFLWKESTGLVAIPGSLYNTRAVADDGARVVGLVDHPVSGFQTSGFWTAASGMWDGLGPYPGFGGCPGFGEALAVSADGSKIGGELFQGCNRFPYTWSAGGGYVVLPITGNAGQLGALSGDGQVAGGWDTHPTLGFRRGALWDAAGVESFPLVSPANPDGAGEVNVLNHDGSAYAGLDQNLGAFVFRDGAFTYIDVPNNNSIPTGLSDDGGVVVGSWGSPFTPPKKPWVWTAEGGAFTAAAYFAAQGVSLPAGVELTEMHGVSADGLTYFAEYVNSGGPNGALVIQLPEAGAWTDLGGGTVGSNGAPTLVGTGPLSAGSSAGLELTDAPPGAALLAWLSFASAPFSALGGTVYATPFAQQFLFGAQPDGSFTASTTWPAGIPADTPIWFQFIVEDGATLHGLTLSNGLLATTP